MATANLQVIKYSQRTGKNTVYGKIVRKYKYRGYEIGEIYLQPETKRFFKEKYLIYSPFSPMTSKFGYATTLESAEKIAVKMFRDIIKAINNKF